MSFALLRKQSCGRIPLVRYSALTKRENRVQIQLLKDFPQYGVKGEILNVLPGLMRNKLYPNNGACYVIPKLGLGPRIPVVKREQKPAIQQQPKQQPTATAVKTNLSRTTTENKIKPITIEGLLLDLPEDAGVSAETSASSSTYSLSTLEIELSSISIRTDLKEPIKVSDIVEKIWELSGIKVPESDIKVSKGETTLTDITEAGEYRLVISPDFGNRDRVTKDLYILS